MRLAHRFRDTPISRTDSFPLWACKQKPRWDISGMMTSVKADRGRLIIRGLKDGGRYLVEEVAEGWFVRPEPEPRAPKRRREWAGPKRDLTEHLDALAKAGLRLPKETKPNVPPCRF